MGRRGGGYKPVPPSIADYWQVFGLDHLPYRILLVGRMIDRLTAQHIRAVAAMSAAEWRVLAHLAVLGEQTASTVSSVAFVERSEVSRAVSLLTATGLIEQRLNPSNQKSRLLSVTAAGRDRFDQVRGHRQRFFTEVMADFDEEEAAAFDMALLRVAKRLERMASDERNRGDDE